MPSLSASYGLATTTSSRMVSTADIGATRRQRATSAGSLNTTAASCRSRVASGGSTRPVSRPQPYLSCDLRRGPPGAGDIPAPCRAAHVCPRRSAARAKRRGSQLSRSPGSAEPVSDVGRAVLEPHFSNQVPVPNRDCAAVARGMGPPFCSGGCLFRFQYRSRRHEVTCNRRIGSW